MIETRELTKRYDEFTAVDRVNLSIAEGQFAVLLGPSGSGKTTLLRMLNRMVEPTSGSVLINGQDTTGLQPETLRRSMGYVIQSTGLFPNMTIRRNVATVPRLLGWDRRRTDDRVDEMLDLVGLDAKTYGPKRPDQLSGGEAQRVGVARALAADPPVLLMDEPTGSMDHSSEEEIKQRLRSFAAGKTLLVVTHRTSLLDLVDRIIVIDSGKVVADGPKAQVVEALRQGRIGKAA